MDTHTGQHWLRRGLAFFSDSDTFAQYEFP